MHTTLNLHKLCQSASVFLGVESSRSMSYMRLLKLLYIADRTSIRDRARPIIGGKAVAMKCGPLHSEVYDLIKDKHPSSAEWNRYFQKNDYQIQMISDPGTGSLSPRELATLRQVAKDYAESTEWDLVDLTHGFPEWQSHSDVGNSSEPIHVEEMLDALGMGGEKDEIVSEMRELREIDKILGTS